MKCKHSTLLVTFVFLALLGLGGCKDEGSQGPETGASRMDAGPRPTLQLAFSAPLYGLTNLDKTQAIGFTILTGKGSFEDQVKLLHDSIVIETYPEGKVVAGTWEQDVKYTPSAPLAVGDYVVRFPNASQDFVVVPRPYNVFRVGSALRVRQIEIYADKTGGQTGLSRVEVVMSEASTKLGTLAVAVEAKDSSGTWSALASGAPTLKNAATLAITASQVLDPKRSLRVTISGSELDGKWTGVAGSGSVVSEFVPAEHQIEGGQVVYPVPPDLTIELPSGKPKAN